MMTQRLLSSADDPVILWQLFDPESGTLSYLVAHGACRDAFLFDPVLEQMPGYLALLAELGLHLSMAVDTHTHADHVTALLALQQATGCQVARHGLETPPCVTRQLVDHDLLRCRCGGLEIEVWHTPGHTGDSCCFVVPGQPQRLLTGDTLFIEGTGRTDLPSGDAHQQGESLLRLLAMDDATVVLPGHDYRNRSASTIGHERTCNHRLQVLQQQGAAAYAALMETLHLPPPRLMDVALRRNSRCGAP